MSEKSHRFSTRWPSYVSGGPFLFFGGQMGRHPTTKRFVSRYEELAGKESGAHSSYPWVASMEGRVGAQAVVIYDRYRRLLKQEGSDLGHLLRYHIYQRDKHFFSVFDGTRRLYEKAPPSSTAVGMGRFEPTDTATLCVDAIAVRAAAERTLGRREVLGGSTRHAAAAHFSHVIGAGPFLFLAGQIPVDTSIAGAPLIRGYDDIPEAGRFLRVGRSHEDARNGPIAAQTWFTYDLIRQHLEAVGSSMDSILNLIVYLQDIRDFPTFHRVHERFFKSSPPALTVIEVAEVGHKGTLIEIEATSIVPGRRIQRIVVEPAGWQAPAQMSPLVHAGGLAFLSGIIGTGATRAPVMEAKALPAAIRSRVPVGMTRNASALQCVAALHELAARLAAARRTFADVAHLTVYLQDIDDLAAIERLIAREFGKWRPALTALEVAAPAPLYGARVSLTAIGWFGDGPLEAHD